LPDISAGGHFLPPPEYQKIRQKSKIQNSSALCLQFIYIHPLTLQGGGGKLLLALKEKEC